MTDYSRGYRAGLEAAAGVAKEEAMKYVRRDATLASIALEIEDRILALPVPGEAPELNPHAICGTCGTVRERHGSGGLGHDFNETPPPVRAPAPPAEAPDLRGLLKEAHAALKCETCDLDHPGQMRVLVRVEAPDEREVYELVPCGECDSYPERVAARARIDAALAAQPEGQAAPQWAGLRELAAKFRNNAQAAVTATSKGYAPSAEEAWRVAAEALEEIIAGAAAPVGEDAEALLRDCEAALRDAHAWPATRYDALLDRLAARAGGSR